MPPRSRSNHDVDPHPHSTSSRRSGERGLWRGSRGRRAALALLVAPVALIVVAALLTLRPPAWYEPPRIPESRHQAVRDQLQDVADRFSAMLLGTAPFLVEFTQDQLNQWITLRERMWPAARDMLPADLGDPFVRLEPGRIVLAAALARAPGRPVVSVALTAGMEDDALAVRIAGCRVGTLPVPLTWLARELRRVRIDRASGVSVGGSLADGLRIGTHHTWWNGRRDYRVRRVEALSGLLRVEIEPLGPHLGR
jgi:hypothetical protein